MINIIYWALDTYSFNNEIFIFPVTHFSVPIPDEKKKLT